MRGRYNKGSKRVFTSSGYKFAIGAIIAIAIALVMLLLVLLPVTEDTIVEGKEIVSIVSNFEEIGVNSDLSKFYCKVYYSDGTSDEVAFDQMIPKGLDIATVGTYNVSLNYGGFEQTVSVEVKNVDCILQYQASVGGRIQGETRQSVANGSDAATVIAIPETGYVFDSWNDDHPLPTRTDRSVNKNATYIASFKKAQYIVRFFDPEETVASEEKVAFGESPKKIPNPDSDPTMKIYGHTFSNWIPAEFSNIDRDMDIYPEYIKTATDVEVDIPTDIYGNAMGSTDINEYGYYAYGESATITAKPYNSRRFAYWLIQNSQGVYQRLDPESTATFNVGSLAFNVNFTSTKLGNNQYILSFEASQNINKVRIRAIFAYEQSTISFVDNQSAEGNISYSLFYGNNIGSVVGNSDFFTADKGPGEVIGMKFLGWYTEGTNLAVTEDSTFEQPTTVIAKWEKRVYTVRFFYEGDETYDKRIYVQYQNALASATSDSSGNIVCGIPSEIPYKKHYIFVGWQNSITQESIDDKTKITTHPLYLDNGKPTGDFANRIVTMVPIFTPIKHKLTVAVKGAGSVSLNIKEGTASTSPERTINEINGTIEIREDFLYTLTFEASTGYALKSVIWTHQKGSIPYYYENNEDNLTMVINELSDNDIVVEFDHKKFDINFSIDESVGSIEYLGEYLIPKDNLVKFKVDYNASINIIVGTINAEYAIENIMVDGEYLVFENGEFMGADLHEYTLKMENIKNNIDIVVNYKSKKHKIVTPSLSSGSIKLTSIYNPTVTTEIENRENEYIHGSENVYRINAPANGFYISSIKINGYAYDLYNSGKSSLIYHNWYVNSVSSQITILDIANTHYYHYGNFIYNGKTYAYCQTVRSDSNQETTVFEVLSNGSYNKIIDTAIIDTGYDLLNINTRNIYSTSTTKDLRITAIDLLLHIDMNYSIEVQFSPINYRVNAQTSNGGTVTITNSVVGYNGQSTVTARPKTGYYIYGYTINGGNVVVANLPELTSTCPIRFMLEGANDTRIREDKDIAFIYKKIQIAISVKNTTTAYNVYLDGSLLNSSIDKFIDYKESGSYQISLDNSDYRISSITITTRTKTGEVVNEVVTHYNMTSYVLTFNDVTETAIVEIACALKTGDISQESSVYTIEADESNIQNITYSADYKVAHTEDDNEIVVIADAGYYIERITLWGNLGNSLIQDYDNLASARLSIPAGTFATGEKVSIRVASQVKQYNITTTVVGGQDLDFVKRQQYGASVAINIREVANHYISKFILNGEEVSFDNNNWVEKRRNESIKEYISGTYTLFVTRDTTIYLEYSLNEYSITLDSNSINGSTTFYSNNPIVNGKIKHGQDLIINMKANTGYHIKSLYINNVKVENLDLPSSIPNNNPATAYTYNGVISSIVIRVVYEINRYSFTYEIENISENFALYETEPGALTTENNLLKVNNNMFTGIEYGRNFYINAIPATLNGYYLVSITIRYDSRDLTIYAHEGSNSLISPRGGMIYFNTILDFNEGIRQDVQLIKLTFNKLNYDISLHQESQENTGNLKISYEHPNNASNIVTLFGDNGNLYYYYPETDKVKDTEFNDLVWTFNPETGKYSYSDINGDQCNLRVEHGTNYYVTATPALGYRRTHFLFNGNDVNNTLNNNVFRLNMGRNTIISVEFVILTYTINFAARVADKNLTGRIPDSAILNYATISIVDYTDPFAPISYTLGSNTSFINKVFNYGSKIKLEMTPKFATTGYYLNNLYYIDREIKNFEQDTKSTVIYGGEDGISLTSDINAIANFQITIYRISTVIDYIEPIKGESANTLINEGSTTIAWGDTATIKVANGNGYELGEIYVKRGNGQPIFVTLTPTDEQLATDLEKYVKNDYSIVNGTRDVIVIRKATSDLVITAKFIRKDYTVNFNFTNANFLESIAVSLNMYNLVYPKQNPVSGYWTSGSTYQIIAKHYDELSGVIKPKNGYEIMQTSLTLRAVYWDEATLSYKSLKDYGGNDIVYHLPFTKITGDTLSFTFHEATKIIADLTMQSDLMVDLTVRIKTYTIDTSINRNSSSSEAPNTTPVTMSVKTEAGQNVRVNNVAQVPQNLTVTNAGKIFIAEHHGTITYEFDAPEGYMLSNIFVNGINWTESKLKTSRYSDEYLEVNASKISGTQTYRYVIVMKVKDPLIAGYNHIVYNDMADLTIEITVKLITYQIKTMINGIEYESAVINNKNTFTDNKTIKIVTANSTNHYNHFNISPEISLGYQVTGMNMSIYNGGVLTNIGYAFNISQANTLQINHTNLKYVNILADNLVLYICYTTEIKKYNVDIFSYAYSIDMWQDKTEGRVSNNSDAGLLSVSALTNGVRTDNITTVYRHEYFSIITAVVYAKQNYVLYTIQEYIGSDKPEDWLTSSNWVDVKDGVRGMNYSYVTEPNGTVKHTFEYQVNDYGDRTFRTVFRQQTTVTINVINPYRFSSTIQGSAAVGNMNYIYYPEIIAKIGGVEVSNIYDNGANRVVDTYIYKVNVGSVMMLEFFDNGTKTNDTFGIYYIQDGQYVENTAIRTTGYEIRAKWDFYLTAKTKLYITYQKEANAANSASQGGAILFGLNGGDLVNNDVNPTPVYREATVTQTVTIMVQPYQNFIFTALKVRQIDQVASRLAGKIVYAQGTSGWLTYNASNFEDLDSNGFIISQSVNAYGHTIYTITMTGNMELSFVFYKTYNINYSANYSDIGTINDVILKNNKINNNLCDSNSVVSYNSNFTLTAKEPDTNVYQFMGWYINGVNTYKYLSTRYPDSNRYTSYFEINDASMTLTQNNVELDNIVIVALYQRIINVSVINELYYYDTQTLHWNSWTTGTIKTQYYDYVPSNGLPLSKTTKYVNNMTAATIASINNAANPTYSFINNQIGGIPSGFDTYWNTLGKVPASFDVNTLKAYSSSTFFKVLYQNVNNQNFVANTWTTSDIDLMMSGVPNTVKLQAWQYYNWTSGTYQDIAYSYTDPSGLRDSLGNEIIIDSTSPEYLFNLGYIYSGNMPGAISAQNGDARPLIIRPFLRKVVSIDLEKLTYIDKLGGNFEYEFAPEVGPSINSLQIEFPQTNNFYNLGMPFQYISDDNRSGEFDYGAKIEIRSYRNVDDEGYPVYSNEIENYRFVGWFINWEVNGSARYRYILDMDGAQNKAGENYLIYMAYAFGEEPPENDTIQYRAVYINQYAHNIYSYNIAGGNSYEDAQNSGPYAYKDAPAIDRNSVSINTEAVPFATYDTSKTGNSRAGITELNYDLEFITYETHKLEFYIDIGCVYTFDMDMSYTNHVANYLANNQYSNPYGYDPSYDKQHKIKFSTDPSKEASYASALSSSYIFSGVNLSNPIDGQIAVSKNLQIDIQYVSEVKMVFNNLMYRAGITVPYNMSNQLSNGNNDAITVWDDYANFNSSYGDPVREADGTVHVYFRLNSDRFTNFYNEGVFKYVPRGYTEGLGIPLNKLVYYVNTGNNNQTLFSPSVAQYRRHIVVDISTYIQGGSLLFGDPDFEGDPYSVDNVGDGSESNPYRIFTVTQFRNINLFWYYNEFSCGSAHFKLFSDLNLQGLTSQYSSKPYMVNGVETKAWIPMCYAGDESSNGFNGVLLGNGYSIYGLAALGSTNLVDTGSTSSTPLHERHDYTFGYGIFGLIKGGKVEGLNIGNAYIDVSSLSSGVSKTGAVASNVGVLAAVIEDATISGITFIENIEVGRFGNEEDTAKYRIYIQSNTTTNGIGILAGSVRNSTIDGVTLDVYNKAADDTVFELPQIGILGEKAGSLIGSIQDDFYSVLNGAKKSSNISNLQIKSSAGAAKIFINTTGSSKYAGGVIGYMEAVEATVADTKVNFVNNAVSNNVIFQIGNDNTVYVGGVVGVLKQGTLKDTIFVSNANSVYRVKKSVNLEVLNYENSSPIGAVGGIAGYNSGIITNRSIKTSYGSDKPFAYSYTQDGIRGTFNLYGPISGGIAGRNIIEPFMFTKDGKTTTLINGEIIGFKLDISKDLVINAPYILQGSSGVLSGIKGGIVGYNMNGALVDDCSFGETGTRRQYLYVYDQNATAEKSFDLNYYHASRIKNTSDQWTNELNYLGHIQGNLYIGGIAGATQGAIYNSFVASREIFVKYYNSLSAEKSREWNVYIGGIAGAQNLYKDSTLNEEALPQTPLTTTTVVNFPNVFSAKHYMNYNWRYNNGELNDQVMKLSLEQRTNIQSCYVSDVEFNIGIYIWCDNTNYKPEGDHLVGQEQNISIGGIVGYNLRRGGSASVNHCYSYNNTFRVRAYAFGSTSMNKGRFDAHVGYFDDRNFLGIGSIFINRLGTNLGINVRGIVGGKTPDYDSAAIFCWTYNNTLAFSTTGNINSAPSDKNDMRTGPNPNYRLIGYVADDVNVDAIAKDTGIFCNANKQLAAESDYYWGYDDKSGADSFRKRLAMTSVAGFVGWNESPDGRIYRTDAETGMLMVWHGDFREANNLSSARWYTADGAGEMWFALQGDYYKTGTYNAAVASPNFLSSYLVRGQTKYTV